MALNVSGMEGNEIADDYIRKPASRGRWGETWDVFKSCFFKLVLLNIFVLITVVPGVAVMVFRDMYVSGMETLGPGNPSISISFDPNIQGWTQSVKLSADLLFYSVLIVAGLIASIGISGAAYSIRKMLNTHGEFKLKNFFHGIRVGYFSTVLPVTILLIFVFSSVVVGDWKDVVAATGGNVAGAITAQIFVIIATVVVGIYCGWLFAVGNGYRVKVGQLFKNAFVMVIGTPLQTVLMAGFSLIPVWFYIIGGFMQMIAMVIFIFIGFSFILICWLSFTQWGFDLYVTPNIKAAQEDANSKKSEKQLALEKQESDKQAAMELLAAGKSELIARPIMPIASEAAVKTPSLTFTRADLARADADRAKLSADISGYEEEHKNDPVYVEYNRLFAEREKALQPTGKKGKKAKKISSDNLLK